MARGTLAREREGFVISVISWIGLILTSKDVDYSSIYFRNFLLTGYDG